MILDKIRAKFKKPNPNLSKPILELGLSLRTYHCLRKAGIATVGDLVQLSRKDIKAMRGSVRKTCEEVERFLKRMGLGLREDGR